MAFFSRQKVKENEELRNQRLEIAILKLRSKQDLINARIKDSTTGDGKFFVKLTFDDGSSKRFDFESEYKEVNERLRLIYKNNEWKIDMWGGKAENSEVIDVKIAKLKSSNELKDSFIEMLKNKRFISLDKNYDVLINTNTITKIEQGKF